MENQRSSVNISCGSRLLITPMGVHYVVIGFDMEVQPSMQFDLYALASLHRCREQS